MTSEAAILVRLQRRIADLERRVENGVRHGTVEEVDTSDTKAPRVRLRIGGTEERPQLSPWLPYSQFAGAFKMHTPPVKGQTLTVLSPGGDFRQGFAIPLSFSEENPSPSDKPDQHVMAFGNVTITITADGLSFVVGGSRIDVTEAGVVIDGETISTTGTRLEHNGRNVGATHRHPVVGTETMDPNE